MRRRMRLQIFLCALFANLVHVHSDEDDREDLFSLTECRSDSDCESNEICQTVLGLSLCQRCYDCQRDFGLDPNPRTVRCITRPSECRIPCNEEDFAKCDDGSYKIDEYGKIWYSEEFVNLILFLFVAFLVFVTMGIIILFIFRFASGKSNKSKMTTSFDDGCSWSSSLDYESYPSPNKTVIQNPYIFSKEQEKTSLMEEQEERFCTKML